MELVTDNLKPDVMLAIEALDGSLQFDAGVPGVFLVC